MSVGSRECALTTILIFSTYLKCTSECLGVDPPVVLSTHSTLYVIEWLVYRLSNVMIIVFLIISISYSGWWIWSINNRCATRCIPHHLIDSYDSNHAPLSRHPSLALRLLSLPVIGSFVCLSLPAKGDVVWVRHRERRREGVSGNRGCLSSMLRAILW
jgi:hypothetical protein